MYTAFLPFNPNIQYIKYQLPIFSDITIDCRLRQQTYCHELKKHSKHLYSRYLNASSSPETRGARTPDNLIKSQVLYHLS